MIIRHIIGATQNLGTQLTLDPHKEGAWMKACQAKQNLETQLILDPHTEGAWVKACQVEQEIDILIDASPKDREILEQLKKRLRL